MNIGLICNDDIILAQLCILIKLELYYKWIIMAPSFGRESDIFQE